MFQTIIYHIEFQGIESTGFRRRLTRHIGCLSTWFCLLPSAIGQIAEAYQLVISLSLISFGVSLMFMMKEVGRGKGGVATDRVECAEHW